MKSFLLILGFFLFFSCLVQGQTADASQTISSISYAKDTAVINQLIKAGIARYNIGQLDEAIMRYKKAREKARQIGYEAAILESYLNEGVSLYRKSDFIGAINCGNEGLLLAQKLKDSVSQSASINTIGVSYMSMGNNTKAMTYYFKGLAIEEKITNQRSLHWFYSNIGNLYREQKNYQKSLEYSYKAITQEKKEKMIRHW